MGELERDARSGGDGWEDPVGRLIDEFSERYRQLPGYRALWFGRELSDELREADRENKRALASGVRRIAVALGLARDDAYLRVASRAGVLVTDSILQEAFRSDPFGDAQLIEEAKRILRLYLAEVVRHYAA